MDAIVKCRPNRSRARATLIGVRSRSASEREVEGLYRDRFVSFVRVASAICGDPDSGRDAVQSAFVSALVSRDSFRGEGSLQAWVWRIVVNEARRTARAPRAALDDGAGLCEGCNGNVEEADPLGVRRWVAALPPRQREVVFLRYFADLDYRTIGEVLDLETGTVSATLSAAHATLRTRLERARP